MSNTIPQESRRTFPLVSIVIPVYNQTLAFFQQALQSALDQTYPTIDVVISNNHSTNDIPAFLASLTDTRIRIVKPNTFLPMAQHFQFAGDQARGDFILYLCSDDWLYPDCVQTMMPYFDQDPGIVAGYGEVDSVHYNDLNQVKSYYNRKTTGLRTAAESLNETLASRPIFSWIPGSIMKRSAYQQVRAVLSDRFTLALDFALMFKLHEVGSIFYVDTPFAKFRHWTPKNGKQGGDRMVESIIDVGHLCTLLETSPLLLGYLKNGRSDVQEWRTYQAKRWVMNLLVGFASGDLSAERFDLAVKTLKKTLGIPKAASFLLKVLSEKPGAYLTKPLINWAYTLYLRVQKLTKLNI